MNGGEPHALRALLLAAIVSCSIVAGTLGFAGGVTASSHHDLATSDGAGGDVSFLVADVDDQLPRGNQSDDDTLRVEATGKPLPQNITGTLRLASDDLAFDTGRNESAVAVRVVGEDGSEATADEEYVGVTRISDTEVAFEVHFDEGNELTGEERPVAVEISNLTFDAGAAETATLTWDVANEEATYELAVERFDPEVTATDENGGSAAHLTAGAVDQQMVGEEGAVDPQPARNLVLEGDEADFPTEFPVGVTVDGDAVTFNESLTASDVEASSSNDGADVTVDSVGPREIALTVSDFEGTAEDVTIVELAGVTYDAAPAADEAAVTWAVQGQGATYELRAEHLDASFEEDAYEITRGLDGEPDSGATVEIGAADRRTDGFHDQDAPMTVEIPGAYRDDVEFATNANPQASMVTSNDVSVSVESDRLVLEDFPDDVDSGDTVTVSNVRFNTTGYDYAAETNEEPAFRSGLDVAYEPVDAGASRPATTTGSEALDVRVPALSVAGDAPTVVDPGSAGTTGSDPVTINVTDTSGGQMASGTDVVVGIEGADGITFDESQEDDLRIDDSAGFYAATNITVEERSITISIADFADSSEKGESVVLEHREEEGLLFDVAESASGQATFSVRTNASDAPVRQQTATAVSTEPVDGGDGGDTGGDGTTDGDPAETEGDATPDGAADVQVVETAMNETAIGVGEAVGVTVTVENAGDADGEFTARLTARGFTLDERTVTVPAGESREVTLAYTFGEAGTYELGVNEEVAVGTLEVSAEPVDVTGGETVALSDGTRTDAGLRVAFEDVSVRSITFDAESATGEVTVEDLSGVPQEFDRPAESTLQVVAIDVPDAVRDDPAVVEFRVDASAVEDADASLEDLTVVHYNDDVGAWDTLDTEVVETDGDTVVLAATTPGFSTFAVTAPEGSTGPTDGTPTGTGAGTDEPLQGSGTPNPFVLGGVVLVLTLIGTLAAAGARLYDSYE